MLARVARWAKTIYNGTTVRVVEIIIFPTAWSTHFCRTCRGRVNILRVKKRQISAIHCVTRQILRVYANPDEIQQTRQSVNIYLHVYYCETHVLFPAILTWRTRYANRGEWQYTRIGSPVVYNACVLLCCVSRTVYFWSNPRTTVDFYPRRASTNKRAGLPRSKRVYRSPTTCTRRYDRFIPTYAAI